jgi:hypothetical protein
MQVVGQTHHGSPSEKENQKHLLFSKKLASTALTSQQAGFQNHAFLSHGCGMMTNSETNSEAMGSEKHLRPK